MKYVSWSIVCAILFMAAALISLCSFPDYSRFITHIVLVPASREYDSMSMIVRGVSPLGWDMGSSAKVSMTVNIDGADHQAVADIESTSERKGSLSSHGSDGGNWGDAYDATAYHKWLESLGLDRDSSLTAQAEALSKIVPAVAQQWGYNIIVDPVMFQVAMNDTTHSWELFVGLYWHWHALITGSICTWLTGIVFIFLERSRSRIQRTTRHDEMA